MLVDQAHEQNNTLVKGSSGAITYIPTIQDDIEGQNRGKCGILSKK